MEEDSTNSSDWSGAAEKLIEAVRSGVGTLYEPTQIRKIAAAKADAALIQVKSETEVAELKARAHARLNHQETFRQKNIDSIIGKSVSELENDFSSDLPDQEWLLNFFESCQNVSSETMQAVWAKILGGEVSQPGKYSIRTLKILKYLQKEEAELFSSICEHTWINIGDLAVVALPIDSIGEEISASSMDIGSLTYSDLLVLQTCGLIEINIWDGYNVFSEEFEMSYFENTYFFKLNGENKLSLSNVTYTKAGKELFPIIYRVKDTIYEQGLLDYWASKGLNVGVKSP